MFKRIEFTLDTLGAIAVVLLCTLIVVSVFCREVLGFGVPDSIIMVRELMVPAILFPLSSATSRRAHVSIEVIANHFPAALNRWIAVLAALIGLIIVVTLLNSGWAQFTKNWANGAHYGGDFNLPKWPSRAVFVIAFFFVTLRLLQTLWVDLVAAFTGQPAPATL
ncbi:MAG: TRAP transporter small permease [Pseudomonadota bacterium]